MNLINQTKYNTCLACVLAMIVNESEQYVLDWFEHTGRPPHSDIEAFIFLAHHGVFLALGANFSPKEETKGVNLDGTEVISVTMNLKEAKAYIVVRSEGKKKGITHAVFWDKTQVFDPLYKTSQKLSKYEILSVYPIMETEIRAKLIGKGTT